MASSTAPAGTRPPGDSDRPPPRRELAASGSAGNVSERRAERRVLLGVVVGSRELGRPSASISFSVDPAATSAAGPRNPVEISFAEIPPFAVWG